MKMRMSPSARHSMFNWNGLARATQLCVSMCLRVCVRVCLPGCAHVSVRVQACACMRVCVRVLAFSDHPVSSRGLP